MSANNNCCELNPALLIVTWLGAILICVIITIYWGADRSLGLGDEGIYLLAARHPEEIQQNVSSVYIYTGYLFKLVGFDPVAFRLLGVSLVSASVFLFWIGFYKFASEIYIKLCCFEYFGLYSFLFILLGGLLLYQWFYLTPNYNTLIGIAINVVAGAMLWGFGQISSEREGVKLIAIVFGVGGVAIGLALFTKFPAGISILFICLLTLIVWPSIGFYKRIIFMGALFCGVLFWAIGHFFLFQSLNLWWGMLQEGWGLYQAYGAYSPQSKLVSYVNELILFIGSSVRIFLPAYVLIFIAWVFFKFRQTVDKVGRQGFFILILIVISFSTLLSVKSGVFIDERKSSIEVIPFYLLFHLGWVILLSTVWAFTSWSHSNIVSKAACQEEMQNRNVDSKIIIVLGLLVALPLAGSMGTQNPIYNVPLTHASTWFGAILILLVFSTKDQFNSLWLRMAGIFSISAFTGSQIIQGYIFDPQTAVVNLHHQVVMTEVGSPVSVLKLDEQEHRLVNELFKKAKAHGFKAGDDIIAFDFIPGLVFALGGKSPGHPTFVVGSREREAYSSLALKFADIGRLKNSYILLDIEPVYVEKLLAMRGINFPKDYVLIATVESRGKNYSLWKPGK